MNKKTDAEKQVMSDEQQANLVPVQKKRKRGRKQVEAMLAGAEITTDSAPAPAGGAS